MSLNPVSKTIYCSQSSLSFCFFSCICFNILYPDESENGVLTWRLNPRQVHYGKTAKSADRGERYCLKDKEHTRPPGFTSLWGLSLLLRIYIVCVWYSIVVSLWFCVCVCGGVHDCTALPSPQGPLPSRELCSAPLWRLHFSIQANLPQWIKSFQITADSYHSHFIRTDAPAQPCGG